MSISVAPKLPAVESMPLRPPVRWHRPLMSLAAVMAALSVVALAGLVVDDRVLVGAPIWLKPFKFAVSFVVYTVTLAWMVSLMRRGRRVAWWSATVIAVAGALEMAIIVAQTVRGRQSHFNEATPLDAALFGMMGALIAALWMANLVIAGLLLWQRVGDATITWTVRLAVLLAVAGMALGFLMVQPTAEQAAGTVDNLVGAHSVGVPDGGPGMALTGWSTTGGDLRIPHFVGMHALQALPLLAMLLGALAGRFPRLRDGSVRLRLVLVGATGYAGLVAIVTWQALRGQPLTGPDGATLAAVGLLAAGIAMGAMAALRPRAAAAPTADRRIGVLG